ncbi:MoxR family ATPase [Alteromonadaceae bacterium M269]|nr:MoxR family ATPase [Alteromonadaceae bacterium M269]
MHNMLSQAITQISQHIIGKESQIKLALSCLLANGHLLIEDLPGMGKTSLSHALAQVLGLNFSRIQFTSDLLPADVLGVTIFDNQQQQFCFHQGPIFSQLVLADEINRASPKTQSALLEAMEEKQVSLDGKTYQLPKPFFVIATQNPTHQSGTYPLPESQLDRFLMRIQLGFPSLEAEKRILQQSTVQDKPLKAVMTVEELEKIQQSVNDIHVSENIIDYLLRLVTLSRESTDYPNSLSPRASKALLHASKAWALIEDRDYVIPEDIQAVFTPIAEHRLRHSIGDIGNSSTLSQQLLQQVDALI